MLAVLDRPQQVSIRVADTFPAPNFELEFPTNGQWLLSSVGYTLTNNTGNTVLAQLVIQRNGLDLARPGFIPWMFAGQVVNNTLNNTPDPPNVALFATQFIGGFIPGDMWLQNGDTVNITHFLGLAGLVYDLSLNFSQGELRG